MEMGYSICTSLEECRQNLLSVTGGSSSSVIFGPASIAKVLSMMIRTYSGLDTQSTLTYWPGDNANHDLDKPSNNSITWNVEVFVHTIKDLVLYFIYKTTIFKNYYIFLLLIFILESIIVLVRCF